MHQSLSILLEAKQLTSTTSLITDRIFALANPRTKVSTFVSWCTESTFIVLSSITSIDHIREKFLHDDVNDHIAQLTQLHCNTPVSAIASYISLQHL
jgi:hypothetical protein